MPTGQYGERICKDWALAQDRRGFQPPVHPLHHPPRPPLHSRSTIRRRIHINGPLYCSSRSPPSCAPPHCCVTLLPGTQVQWRLAPAKPNASAPSQPNRVATLPRATLPHRDGNVRTRKAVETATTRSARKITAPRPYPPDVRGRPRTPIHQLQAAVALRSPALDMTPHLFVYCRGCVQRGILLATRCPFS
jgi:hypothetical protein